jgi:hypothetical protein
MEEDDLSKGWKKTQPKKNPFSNRLIYPTFRTALTAEVLGMASKRY